MELREYQKRPIAKAIDFFSDAKVTPKLMVFPTGWGKSHLIAHVVNEVEGKFLIIQPSKELLEQNMSKYTALGEKASVYSASFSKKEFGNAVFATIGSIKDLGEEFKARGITNVIIDEADRYPQDMGMLPAFLRKLGSKKVLGITATPIKLMDTKYGKKVMCITTGLVKNKIFNDIIHVSQVSEMVELGYWAPLVYEQKDVDEGVLEFNTIGTEYTDDSLNQFYYTNDIENKIVEDIKARKDRKSWLIFVPSIEDAESLERKLEGFRCITAATKKKQRNQWVEEYKLGELHGLISINALSVGFDHNRMDGIICARPTASISWYMQALGRGVRTHPDKKDCLIIDYSGNVSKFGRIEHLFYSKAANWELYGENNRKLTGFIPKHAWGTINVEPGYRYRKNNVMPFGKYRGVRVKNLPPAYIVTLRERYWEIEDPNVKAEIELMYHKYKYKNVYDFSN